MKDPQAEIQIVFRKVFKDPSLVISRHTSASDITGWDSLTHMGLIAELEAHFELEFTFEEVRDLANVGEMTDLIAKKLM